jgi:hypothetical protein
MQGSEILTVSAEISVALAGFSGIVVALRQRGFESWPAHEVLRLRNMLELAAASTLFALLPFLPYYIGASDELTWSLCSLAYSAGLGSWLVRTNLRLRGAIRQRLSTAWLRTYNVGSAASVVLLVVNALAITGPPQLGIYLIGLGWILFFTFSLFVRLVLEGAVGSGVE